MSEPEHTSSEEEEEHSIEYSEPEQRALLLRYTVGSAEENAKAALLVGMIAISAQHFMWFAMGQYVSSARAVMPYHLMLTVLWLIGWQCHHTLRHYSASLFSAALGLLVLVVSTGSAIYTLEPCAAYDAEQREYTLNLYGRAECPVTLWFTPALTICSNLIMMMLTLALCSQYFTLERDWPLLQQAEAAVKKAKSQ